MKVVFFVVEFELSTTTVDCGAPNPGCNLKRVKIKRQKSQVMSLLKRSNLTTEIVAEGFFSC